MLIFDELKKNDPQLRFVAMLLTGAMFVLLVGLWWVQVVSARQYENHLETQSYRTVRIPAVRGKILDRYGRVLAENRPSYNLDLYLDDLRSQFKATYERLHKQALAAQKSAIAKREKELGRSLTKTERKKFALSDDELEQLREQARLSVVDKLAAQISQKLGRPVTINPGDFNRAYMQERALPYPIMKDVNPTNIARFEEQFPEGRGVDLDLQTVRTYPYGTLAGHLLGYVQEDDSSVEGEPAFFNYRLPDYRGVVGVEAGYNKQLRGRAGAEAVLVNNLGYRQTENIWNQPEPGRNVVLTIDLNIQEAAAKSILEHQGADARAAVVVMDVQSGDVLAMVSAPEMNPNYFVEGFPSKEAVERLNDPKLRPRINRATQQNYAPGSIFKPVVALACLQNGLNPNALVDNPGYVYVGRRRIRDLAPPGEYNLKKAIMHSSNTYFITVGEKVGIDAIIHMAQKFHFGQRTGLRTRQETSGILPTLKEVNSPSWHDGDTANLCIGQGDLSVTPLQMAVAFAAIANGGTVLWPRLVERIEPQDPDSGEPATNFPSGLVRDELGVSPHNMQVLHNAMLAETEEGTGQAAQVAGLRICGKTGTAQVMDEHNREIGVTTWFASFAPYADPRYAVVVMVEGGTYGGTTCAPIAHDIYEEILKEEKAKTSAMAQSHRAVLAN
jgi:penicillin-binding protein 2